MIALLLLLAGLGLLVLLALVVVDARGVVIRHLIWRVSLIIALVVAALFGFRYQLVRAIDCLPNCTGVNFVGRDLSEREFPNANFVEAKMARVDLSFANLANSDLSGAAINDANLKRANLQAAFLVGANLAKSDFTGANLRGATFAGANLTDSNLSGIDLSQTELQGAIMNGAILVDVTLSNNFLAGADLRDADLSGANLEGADLEGATLSGADLSGANLRGVNLAGASLNLTTLTGADLSEANLSGASLIGANFSSVTLQGTSLVGALIMAADFDGADFRGANFSHVRGLAQVTDRDLLIDETLQNLNTLQREALRRPSSIEGVIIDDTTIVDAELLPSAVEEVRLPPTDGVRVGILHSVSGDLAFSESAILDATLLAIEEINAAGGVLGRPIVPFVEDGASDPAVFAEKAEKLLNVDEVEVIFGTWTSRSRRAVEPLLDQYDGLLFFPAQYEGLGDSERIIYMGADASQLVIPAVDYLIEQGYESFYLVGTDIIYPRVLNNIIKAQLTETDATVMGEALLPFGETDVEFIVREIEFLNPTIVLSTLTGRTATAFFDQLQADQMSPSLLPVVSFNLAEPEIRVIGAEKVSGHLIVSSYFQTIDTIANFAFVEAYREAYGRDSAVSASVEGGYNAVHLWKALAEAADSYDATAVREVMQSAEISFDGPGGVVQIDPETQHLFKIARVGQVRDDGQVEQLYASSDLIPPDPFLANYSWATELIPRLLESNQ